MIDYVVKTAQRVLNNEIDPNEFYSEIFTHLSLAIMAEIEERKNSEGGVYLNQDMAQILQMYFTIGAIYVLFTIEKDLDDFKKRVREFINPETHGCHNEKSCGYC